MASGVKHGPLIYARCCCTDRRRLFHAGKVFTMKTKITTRPAETVSKARAAITDAKEDLTRSLAKEEKEAKARAYFLAAIHERCEQAAKYCPEEYQPAYIHLLESLFKENDEDFRESEPLTLFVFNREILIFLTDHPEVDPFDVAEFVDYYPDAKDFAERLRMLSRLRLEK
jgi:hypothetical protein